MKIIVRWLLLAAALLLVAYLYPGVTITSFGSAMIAAFVLGLLNTLLRPILVLLTLPVTLITLGLFLFVINALMFYFAAQMLDGFAVASFTAALIGSLIYSLCGMVIDVAMERMFSSTSRRLSGPRRAPRSRGRPRRCSSAHALRRLHAGAAHLEPHGLKRLAVTPLQLQGVAARPGRPVKWLAGAEAAAVEHPHARLAFEADALRGRRHVRVQRKDAAVARVGDAVDLRARQLGTGALARLFGAGEEHLVSRGLAHRVELHTLGHHAGRCRAGAL